MNIEISDVVSSQCELNEKEALEFLAVALYRYKRINAAMAGEMVGKSELEFHALEAIIEESGIPQRNDWMEGQKQFGF